ncbi:MAG: hypothetical protein R8K50_07865 [Mariprofundus sp.]
MSRDKQPITWLCIAIGLCLYSASIFHQQQIKESSTPLLSAGLPPAAQQLLAGPFAGAAADFNILAVFSIYDAIGKHANSSDPLWQKLHGRLLAAQALDPWFWDTYRLTTGLMGFHQQGTAAAVELLIKGSAARSWDWELPFIAAYLSHDLLHDDQRAYLLMREAVNRPNAPPLAIGLAATFLQSSEGTDASIRFLHYLKQSLPPQYQDVIDARIKRLSSPKSN